MPPEKTGYYGPRLEAMSGWLKTGDTKAMVVAVHGQVIFEYGDVAHATKVASIRKSILSMLYGKYVVNGTVDVRKTVKELGFQEAESFLENEAHATLEHLLTARSGIHLPSGNDELDARTDATWPARPACRTSTAPSRARCPAAARCIRST